MKKIDLWAIKARLRMADFLQNNDGIGTVEMILILVEKYFISYSL